MRIADCPSPGAIRSPRVQVCRAVNLCAGNKALAMLNRQSTIVNRQSKSFTLVELLVVVAIIALLVSILLPSLGRAKELAKRVICLSQQRSIALAQVIYANEYQDRILIGYTATPRMNYWIKQGGKFYLHGMLYDLKYLSAPKSLYCPSVQPCTFAFDWYAPTPDDNTWADNAVRAPLVPRPEVDWDWTKNPPIVADTDPLGNPQSWPRLSDFENKAICADACGYWDFLQVMHVDGVNVAYGDGSAQWVDAVLFLGVLKAADPDGWGTLETIWEDIFDAQR